jgi:hypothetical protein
MFIKHALNVFDFFYLNSPFNMSNLNKIRLQQMLEMQEICLKKKIDYKSMESLLESERIKKLQKRNHYIQQSIDSEIEKSNQL